MWSNRIFSVSAWFEVRTVREIHKATFPVLSEYRAQEAQSSAIRHWPEMIG
jgi:hypothetical protein